MEDNSLDNNQNNSQSDVSPRENEIVLACIDGSAVSEAVCDYSSWIAIKSGTPLKLLHTIEHKQTPAVSDLTGAIGLGSQQELLNELTELEQSRGKLLIKKGQLLLEAAKQRVIKAGFSHPKIRQRHGRLSESLIELEDKTGLIVMGIRGEEHEQSAKGIGTQLETIIRSLHKPILVVTEEYVKPKQFMLAYDGSESCKKALTMVAQSSLCKGIPCHIVHVGGSNVELGNALLEEAANVLKQANIEVITNQIFGNVEDALSDYQTNNNIDLMAMGAFSHNRFRDFLLGSFTAKMLAATKKPLLLLR
jgi:nucleotide-binding universal stress UspA family protein